MSESSPGATVGGTSDADMADEIAPRPSMSSWLRTSYYTYHQGPRPRIGEIVSARGELGVVMGHEAREDRIFLRIETGERLDLAKSEVSSLRAQRLSLHDLLQLYAREAVDASCSLSIAHLAVHFAGGNGLRYAHRQAELWMYRALAYLGYLGPNTSQLARWLNDEIQKERAAGLEGIPEMIPERDMGSVDLFYKLSAEEKRARVESQFGVQHGLALAADQIKLTLTDGDETPDVEGLERCLAVDVHTERTVVVVCPAGDPHGSGNLVAIDLDTLWPYLKHISGLELTGEALDPGWFWDVLTGSAIEHPCSAAYIGFLGHLQGPDGVDVDVPERRRVGVIAALMAMEAAVTLHRPSSARRHHKQAKELLRGLDKAERSRLVAAVPELVKTEMPKSLPDYLGGRLTALFKAALADMALALGKAVIVEQPASVPAPAPAPEQTPEPAPVDIETKSELPDLDGLDAAYDPGPSETEAAPPETEAPKVDAQPGTGGRVPVTRRRSEKVTFTPAARALRFAVTEKLLFAAEWKLADVPEAHAAAVTVALEWLEQRLGMTLPKHWSEGAHEIERAGVTVQIEAASRLFAFRLEHPDTEHPTRWWRVEATVLSGRDDAGGGMVGLRMQVRDLVEGLPTPMRSVPGLVRSWSGRPGLIIAGARAGNVTHMRRGDSLARLVKIIRNPERETLVCVVREGGVRLPVQGPLAGLVRVIVIPEGFEGYEAEYGELRADHVHLFWPGQRKPEFFSTTGPDWLAALRERALDARHRPGSPTFASVRDAIRAYRKDRADQLADRLAEVEAVVVDPGPSMEDLQSARREASELEELLDVAESERDRANEERDLARLELEEAEAARIAAQAEAEALRHALARLQAARGAAAEPPPASADTPAVPKTLEGLPDWAPAIEPRVAIADKALRHAVKVDHRETHKIYAALQGLHDHYWAMRFAESDEERVAAREAWRQFAQHHRFVVSQVGQAIRTGRYQDEYKATVDGVSYMASLHLSGSSAKDTARCLRVYMDVDEANRRLVVTHLPTHLTNSLT